MNYDMLLSGWMNGTAYDAGQSGTNFMHYDPIVRVAHAPGFEGLDITSEAGAPIGPLPGVGGKLVLGLGADGASYLEVLDPTQGFDHSMWLTTWTGGGGESRPVACDVDGDGNDELVIGMGPGSQGWVEVKEQASSDFAHSAWLQVDWPEYNAANGETWPACGDLDGDGADEIVLGLGAGGDGYATVLDDGNAGYALMTNTPNGTGWIRVGWDAYNNGASGGEVRPAIGNLDGDAAEELVLGLGSGGAGWVILFDDQSAGFAPIFPANAPYKSGAWMQLTWNSYNVANGEVWPAVCDLNGDGMGEIVMGVGTGGDGFVQIFDSATGFAPAAGTPQATGWLQLEWPDYRAAEGTVHPACGNLDEDAADELVLGLGVYPADGGWLEVFDDLNNGLQGTSWAKLKWPTYNNVSGLTRPAIVE